MQIPLGRGSLQQATRQGCRSFTQKSAEKCGSDPQGGKDGVHALDFREVVAAADGAEGVAVGMVGGDARGSDTWQPVIIKRTFKFADAA